MRRTLLIFCGAAAALLVSGCSSAGQTATTPPPASVPPTATADPLRADIISVCAPYADAENMSISSSGGTTTVNLFDPKLGAELSSANAAGQAPDGWTDTREAIVALSGSIEPLSNTSRVLIYLKDAEDGAIYLTACDGASMYDAFSPLEVPDYNAPTISLEEFNQISTGMTYTEVTSLIGSPGEMLSSTDSGLGPEHITELWSWEGEGSLGANANVMFQGGKVTSKAQSGLE